MYELRYFNGYDIPNDVNHAMVKTTNDEDLPTIPPPPSFPPKFDE